MKIISKNAKIVNIFVKRSKTMIEWFITTIIAILKVFGTMYLVCLFMFILHWIGTFFDWLENKQWKKDYKYKEMENEK